MAAPYHRQARDFEFSTWWILNADRVFGLSYLTKYIDGFENFYSITNHVFLVKLCDRKFEVFLNLSDCVSTIINLLDYVDLEQNWLFYLLVATDLSCKLFVKEYYCGENHQRWLFQTQVDSVKPMTDQWK